LLFPSPRRREDWGEGGFEFWSLGFVSGFACLREAASAKAGISCFGFLRFGGMDD